jgi:hypothetical protein
MLYHEFYEEGLEWIGSGIREGLAALSSRRADFAQRTSPRHPSPLLLGGLYLPTLNRDGTREEAERVVQGAGADGVSFFEMNVLGL